MKRILLGLLLLVTSCGQQPVAPALLFSTTASVLQLDHASFSSIYPQDVFGPNGTIITSGTPIEHAAAYFYVGHATRNQGDGQAQVSLPPGTPLNGLSAYVYLDDDGLSAGSARIIDVGVWRVGYAICTVFGSPSNYCPVAWVSVTVDDRQTTPNGWRTPSQAANAVIESGFTYLVIANLRGDPPPHHRVRVGYVDIAYGTTPAPAFAVVPLTGPTRARLILAARQLMP